MSSHGQVTICDLTLRDGNHAIAHQLGVEDIQSYSRAAERAGVDVVEVGHGNGLGASSLQVGRAALTDTELLTTARAELHEARIGVLSIPGFATVERDLKPALDCGVDEVRGAPTARKPTSPASGSPCCAKWVSSSRAS